MAAIEDEQPDCLLNGVSIISGAMVMRTPIGPRLEALLDERDHLRIRINLAGEDAVASEEVAQLRQRLLHLDHEIIRHWGATDQGVCQLPD